MGYFEYPDGTITMSAFNLKGEPVKRTKMSHPYTYDEFVLWLGENSDDRKHTIYADRMRQQDHEKYKECSTKVWGKEIHYFDNINPKEAEEFLSLFLNEKVQLKALTESCNYATGYPIFAFHF